MVNALLDPVARSARSSRMRRGESGLWDQDTPGVTVVVAEAVVPGSPQPAGRSAAIPRPRTIVASSFFMMTS